MHQRVNHWRLTNYSIAEYFRCGIASLAGGVALGTTIFLSPASAAELTNWQFDPATQQLQLTVPAGTTPRYFLLAQPARIVLDLPNTQVGNVAAQQSFAGAVRQIRVGQFDETSTRIVIELSPDAVLAPEHVELQSANGSATGGTQWVLRPLLANGTVAAQSAPVVASPSVPAAEPPTTAESIAVPPVSPAPITPASVPPSPPATTAPVAVAPVLPPASLSPSAPPVDRPAASENLSLPELNTAETPAEPSAALPPLEPNAIEIPIEPSTSAAVVPPVETAVLPSDSATSTVTTTASPTVSSTLPPRPAEPSLPTLPAREPILLPPAVEAPSPPSTVQVPSITQRPTEIAPPAPPQLEATAPVELPPALPSTAPANAVTVPPLSPTPARAGSSVEFGQPPAPVVQQAARSILLPAGTVLSLRYPRDTPLQVESGSPRQEVLVLQAPVRDRDGAVILPVGTQVIGRFEAERGGSRFVAQALTLEGSNVRLNAESASSDREISNNDLLVHSALGAIALTLLGGFSGIGLVGGAAAGAATTFLSTPEPIVIQPNQVIEVRLTEDVLQ